MRMLKPAADPVSWDLSKFPREVRPLPLDRSLRPLDREFVKAAKQHPHLIFLVAPAASVLHPDLIELTRRALAERPEVGVFYADDAVMHRDGTHQAYCKPSFNKALFLADDYIGFPLLVRGSVLASVVFETGRDSRADWYRFCLSAMRAGISIDRIPHTLIASPDERPKAPKKNREKIACQYFVSENLPFKVVPGRTGNTSCVRRNYGREYPPVTLVVPTRQSAPPPSGREVPPSYIVSLLDSLDRSTWPQDKLTVLIGDDVQDDLAYRGRHDRFALKRVITTSPPGKGFNYAAKMNFLWRQVDTELMVLMNDDIVVSSPNWLEALFTYAMEEDVGGVGGRLLYPDGAIQHAGMFGGIHEVCAHAWYLKPQDARTYCDWALVQRECSVVTGALFATRRSAMEAANGFDETFTLDFNDVDLCLRMRMLGYRIVYEPGAEMFHHEKASRRANTAPGDQVHLFMTRWRDFLEDDPMYSPQLRIDTDDVAPLPAATRWIRTL